METNCKKHYLPHHPMAMPSKSTTKVRIVYDTSEKAGRDVKCLNDCLYRGPITLPDLCGVLLRVHTYFTVVLADVERPSFKLVFRNKTKM